MSALDLFQGDANEAVNRAARTSAPDMPATFGDTFGAAWDEGRLFGQSISSANARAAALGDYLAEIKQKTGRDLSQDFIPDSAGGGQTGVTDFATANDKIAKMKDDYPDLDIAPLSDEEIDNRAVAKSREAQTHYAEISAREKTFGGKAGIVMGGIAAAGADPMNIAALAITPAESVGILATGLKWAGIAGASQAAIEVAGQSFREQVQPGYLESGQPLANIGEAAAFGGVTGGALKALGNAWTRLQTGAWPTSIRDAGNVVASEAHLQNSNIYPGVEGEAAHRTAMAKAGDDIIKGDPVNVDSIITPEIQAAAEKRFEPLFEARDRAQEAQADIQRLEATGSERAPELPFEASERASDLEGHIGDMAFSLQRIAREQGNTLSRADAEIAAQRMLKGSDEQMHADIDRLLTSPSTLAERPRAAKAPEPEALPPISSDTAKIFEPKEIEKNMASGDHVDAMINDLDKMRVEGGEKLYPAGLDEKGEPVFRSLDDMVEEVKANREAAEQIEGCINPPQQEAA